MNALKALCAAGLTLALLSCAAEQKPIEITSAQAMGTVGGLVLSAVTNEPLAAVDVTLLAGGVATAGTTDAAGNFSFAQVPSGEVVVTIGIDGYLSANMRGALQGAGEYPIDNATLTFGPIALIPSTGTFSALLVYDDGSPAGDITLTARSQNRFYDYGAWDSATGYSQNTTVTAKTDATGLVTFTGLPDYILLGDGLNDQISVIVPPIAAASGSAALYRYPGGVFYYHMNAVGATTPLIVLDQPTPGPLMVTASTVQALEGVVANQTPSIVPQAGPIFISFNQPLDANATEVMLLDEGSPDVLARDQTAVVQMSISYNTIQLAFSPELSAASEYNLVIHAVASNGDQLVRTDVWAPFFTAPTATMLKPAMTREVLDAALHTEVMHLVFAEPVGTGVPGNNNFTGANCVLFFSTDLNGTGTDYGDYPGETGNQDCSLGGVALTAEEPDPPGMAGQSGYTKYWRITLPTLPGPASVPVGTPLNVVLSRVTSGGMVMKRVDGSPVPDFVGTQNLILN